MQGGHRPWLLELNAAFGAKGSAGYLFNVVEDPTEQTNLYSSYPDLAASMSALLAEFAAEAVDYNTDSDKEDAASQQAAATGYWGPWVD